MFEAFKPGGAEAGARRRFAVSTAAATATYLVIAVGVGAIARGATMVQEKIVDVTFEKPIEKKKVVEAPPPPPPPPPPQKKIERPKPPTPEPPAPVPAAPAPPPTTIPKAIPKEALPESDPGADKPQFIAPAEGIGGGSRTGARGVQGGVPGGTGTVAAPAPTPTGPVNLPEEATPPVESSENRRPEYPEAMRAAGKEGLVILEIVVTETGRVGPNIKVLRGDPPFSDAAIAAVKTWKYQPAMLAGHAISVFRRIKVPFRLSVGGG